MIADLLKTYTDRYVYDPVEGLVRAKATDGSHVVMNYKREPSGRVVSVSVYDNSLSHRSGAMGFRIKDNDIMAIPHFLTMLQNRIYPLSPQQREALSRGVRHELLNDCVWVIRDKLMVDVHEVNGALDRIGPANVLASLA